jgi:hypothetical protein
LKRFSRLRLFLFKSINGQLKSIKHDLHILTLTLEETRWEKETSNGEEKPPARAQHIALATLKNDRIFVFGGHASPTVRLNDTWWLKVSDLTWTRALGDKAS